MKAVIQRVLSASVTVDGQRVSEMEKGLLVLLGVGKGDTEQELSWMVEKIAGLRIFEDAAGKMNLSLMDTHKAMIVVSQFTLYGDASKGKRPSFIDAEEPTRAKALYEQFVERARGLGITVGTGIFAADMKVALVNDGPVTILLDTKAR
ncbi:MAG: D-aminoacyl-tRNA deacylase [Myxococcaceae bacterium]